MKIILDKAITLGVLILFLIVGTMVLFNANKKVDGLEVIDAEIVEILDNPDNMLKPEVYVKYSYKNEVYSSEKLNTYNSLMCVGDKIRIYIDEETNEIYCIESSLMLGMILALTGLGGIIFMSIFSYKLSRAERD